MARHHHNHLQLPEMDHIQPRNGPHNEAHPLGQKLFVHNGGDAPLRIGPSGHGSTAVRSIDLPSSSLASQYPGHRVGNSGTSHVSFVTYPTGSSSGHVPYDTQPESAPSYPYRSDECFAPVSSHMDNRRAAMKRKNPIIHPEDGMNASDYYVGSSSNTQFPNFVQTNPTPLTEPLHPQMPLSIGPSNWNDQRLVNQEGSQRNVRALHTRSNISLEPHPASTYTSSNIHLPPFHSTASAFVSTSAERNQAPFSVPTRTVPSGATGVTSSSRASRGRPYHPAMRSSSSTYTSSNIHLPTVHGPSDSLIYANGGYAPRGVHGDDVPSFAHPSAAASSSSRAVPHESVIPSYAHATPGSMRVNQASPIAAATASSRHARHVSMAHASSGRNRRARSSFYNFHPLMIEAQRFMMLDHLAFYESREMAADPHRDLRLDIDEMGYEDLLALGEFIGNVNTGLADDKISGCVKEVVCCSSDQTQNDQDDGSCVVCLEGYKDKDSLGILKCKHDFHADCIKKWLQVKNSCPVCKAAAA